MSIKDKVKNWFLFVVGLARLKPIIFVSVVFSLIYGLVATIISTVQLSFFIGITGSYSIILGFAKGYGLAKYKLIKGQESLSAPANGKASLSASIEIERITTKNIAICASAISFLHFSFAIVSTFFYHEDPSHYTVWIILFTATAAFVKVILALVQAIRTRKNHSPIIHQLKLAGMANALVSLALTQRAILYFVGSDFAQTASGIGGIFFSILAGAICLSMFLGINKAKTPIQAKTE